MTAKEMFEDLDFHRPEIMWYSERNGHCISYTKNTSEGFTHLIFRNDDKSFQIRNGKNVNDERVIIFSPCVISLELYKAITQQMKELKWI